MKGFTVPLVLLLLFVVVGRAVYAQVPKSQEATFVESYSPTEVTLKAKGIGFNVDEAERDARKCAVYFLLYSANDAILQTPAEKEAFKAIEQEFFTDANINNYITFMSNSILSKVKLQDGSVKVEKLIRVNREKLKEDLVAKGAIAGTKDLAAIAGNPFIMVLPEVPKGQSPIAALQRDPNIKKGAEVIESYLTARRYEVRVPEQQDAVNDLVSAKKAVAGIQDDIAYKLALSIGADIYISYNVKIEQGSIGKKASVGCRAYETTTARLLGTETGYSPERPDVPEAALIEEAMNFAIDRVLSRINAYWKEDIASGRQYKVIFRITGKFDDPDDLTDALEDVLKEVTTKRKNNATTKETVDWILWQNSYESERDFFKAISKAFEANKNIKKLGAKLKRVNVNRKLMLLEIINS
ncbi:MAG: hypothetical protein CMR00_00580 [[Chlorobium] sp. 445]|nr:MAG: hypothetical protein CMR00_00580 [[Chlorobium] sp. 445]